ncbi:MULTISPECIES: hypothetical protein [unclassified Thiocapsa]|uniref:S10 family serine carboxypeptidase-like protein n=1 Tax=unclassified Thiocapsa TaxID=2641286 RepID=UPI0035B1D636
MFMRPCRMRRLALFAGCAWLILSVADSLSEPISYTLPPNFSGTEAGFASIGPIQYTFVEKNPDGAINRSFDYTTSPAKLWYAYFPAASGAEAIYRDPTGTPLFVFLNGGPGAATSANLFANSTAPYTINRDLVEPGGPGYAPNPWSWTALGHLLYIDPALTGFSYNLGPAGVNHPNPFVSAPIRTAEFFGRGNFNPFIDAAQLLRVVLGFIESHEALSSSPVVFVGESYGGTRVATMMNMLLFSADYDRGGQAFYWDPELVESIRRHFGVNGAEELLPETVASRFGRQILIQPQLTSYQDDVHDLLYWDRKPSIIDHVAEVAGHPGEFSRKRLWCISQWPPLFGKANCAIMGYLPLWDRDRYNWSKYAAWSDELEAFASAQLNQIDTLDTLLGIDVSSVADIKPDVRRRAYKVLGFDPPSLGQALRENPDNQWVALQSRRTESQGLNALMTGSGTLEDAFGPLKRWDRYFTSFSTEVYAAFALNVVAPEYRTLPLNADNHPTYGELFLRNIRYIETFLTDAFYDLVIYSEALPLALEKHESVHSVKRKPGNTERDEPGQFEILFYDGPPVAFYYPRYVKSGHAVSSSEPGKLRSDVSVWLDPGQP